MADACAIPRGEMGGKFTLLPASMRNSRPEFGSNACDCIEQKFAVIFYTNISENFN